MRFIIDFLKKDELAPSCVPATAEAAIACRPQPYPHALQHAFCLAWDTGHTSNFDPILFALFSLFSSLFSFPKYKHCWYHKRPVQTILHYGTDLGASLPASRAQNRKSEKGKQEKKEEKVRKLRCGGLV